MNRRDYRQYERARLARILELERKEKEREERARAQYEGIILGGVVLFIAFQLFILYHASGL